MNTFKILETWKMNLIDSDIPAEVFPSCNSVKDT